MGNPGGGFFACVNASDATQVSAQVYLRGNALARIGKNNIAYAPSQSTYFPKASIQVKGGGFLGIN